MAKIEQTAEQNLMMNGCRSIGLYKKLNIINEGSYGAVYKSVEVATGEVYAIKMLKSVGENNGFPITSLREINILTSSSHENIIYLKVVVGRSVNSIYLVLEYVEHDLSVLLDKDKKRFKLAEVKSLMQQLLRGVGHLHDNWIIHRDLKPANLLLSNRGVLKICDFGLARQYSEPLRSYTPKVSTIWYRSPELLLGTENYGPEVDIWSAGCIFYQMYYQKPLFVGYSEFEVLDSIFYTLTTPDEEVWPGVGGLPMFREYVLNGYKLNRLDSFLSELVQRDGMALFRGLFVYNPAKRLTARQCLEHEYFGNPPRPLPSELFPSWPESNTRHSEKF